MPLIQGETRSASAGMPAGRVFGCGGNCGAAGAAAAGAIVAQHANNQATNEKRRNIVRPFVNGIPEIPAGAVFTSPWKVAPNANP
jgi:hypothetical protein